MSINALHDELLVRILSYLDPLDLARSIEPVCRAWLRLTRNNAVLWRNALHIDDAPLVLGHRPKSRAALLCRRIEALEARSGGQIDSLAVQLILWSRNVLEPVPDHDAVQQIAAMLPRLKLRVLRIEMEHADPTRLGLGISAKQLRRTTTKQVDYAKRQARQLVQLVRSALTQCDRLTELHLKAPRHFSFASMAEGTPLSMCELKRLSIACGDLDAIVDDGSLFRMLKTATHIDLQSRNTPIEGRHISRLLRQASGTLEYFHVESPRVTTHINSADSSDLSPIHLPRLTHLGVQTCMMDPTLLCPALGHLSLLVLSPWSPVQLRGLLSPSICSVSLTIRCSHDISIGLGTLLHDRCAASLQQLVLLGHTQAFVQELIQCPEMQQLNDITIHDNSLPAQMVVDLVASRLAQPLYRRIDKLNLIRLEPFDEKHVAWLQRHTQFSEENAMRRN